MLCFCVPKIGKGAKNQESKRCLPRTGAAAERSAGKGSADERRKGCGQGKRRQARAGPGEPDKRKQIKRDSINIIKIKPIR